MEYVDITLDIKPTNSKKAILVSDGYTECWLPLSQIQNVEVLTYVLEDGTPDTLTLTIPEWLAKKNGLI